MNGKLLVIGTPIGNIGDLGRRALTALGEVDTLACEEPKETKKLYFHYEIPFPKRFIKCNEGNEKASANGILKLLQNGETVGLCSSAGMPGISDPGFRVVAVAVENSIEIDIIPGPSAMTTALLGSGLPTSSHLFLGFPPRKAIRQKKLLEAEKTTTHTLIFYVSPRQIKEFLQIALDILGDRVAGVGKDLTKKYQHFYRGRISEILQEFGEEEFKGEAVVVIAGFSKRNTDDEQDDHPFNRLPPPRRSS
ncbi:MAG: 16S rRNA (cytidine(1402)-2'-O)-methyltransferase [Magnetococcales bacterium]|nr:16S rRNA (cytidine(1402)-2'-O)-methyltransferase [Magnetococcales bacterium]